MQFTQLEKTIYEDDGLLVELDCISVHSEDGVYTRSKSVSLEGATCGLYLAGTAETRIEVEFLDFKVDCVNHHALAVRKFFRQCS